MKVSSSINWPKLAKALSPILRTVSKIKFLPTELAFVMILASWYRTEDALLALMVNSKPLTKYVLRVSIIARNVLLLTIAPSANQNMFSTPSLNHATILLFQLKLLFWTARPKTKLLTGKLMNVCVSQHLLRSMVFANAPIILFLTLRIVIAFVGIQLTVKTIVEWKKFLTGKTVYFVEMGHILTL